MQTLSQEQLDRVAKVIRVRFLNIYKIIGSIDASEAQNFKDRNLYYHSLHKHDGHQQTCCGGILNTIYIPRAKQTRMEETIEQLTSTSSLKSHLPQLLQFCHTKYKAILQKGKKDNLQIDDQTESYLTNQIMTEGSNAYFLNELKKELNRSEKVQAQQPMLHAGLLTWQNKYPDYVLDNFPGQALQKLNENGWAQFQLKRIDNIDKIIKILQFHEKNGDFNQSKDKHRNNSILWLEGPLVKNPQLFKMCQALYSLPFELNCKTKHVCSISQAIQVSYFKNSVKDPKHSDNNIEDTGKKFSILLSLADFTVRLFQETKGTTVKMTVGSILIMKSRYYSYEIQGDVAGYLVRFWINGPPQPKDKS